MRRKETINCLVYDNQLNNYFVESIADFRRRDFDTKLSVIEHGQWATLKRKAERLNAQISAKCSEW